MSLPRLECATHIADHDLRDDSRHQAQLAEDYYHQDAKLFEVERAAWLRFNIDPGLHSAVSFDARSELKHKVVRFLDCCREVEANVSQPVETLARFGLRSPLRESAFGNLTLGRSELCRAILDNSNAQGRESTLQSSSEHLNVSVEEFRRAGHVVELSFGLLTRAWLRLLTGKPSGPESAQADLDEAWEIAERGPMKLFLADIHLYRARLFFRERPYPWRQNPDGTPRGPADDLAAARTLIQQCGYWRRKDELEDAEAIILHKPPGGVS